MPDISISESISHTELGAPESGSFTDDQTNKRVSAGTKSIPTTAAGTAFPLGDVTTPRWARFKNMEAAGGNYVQIGIQVAGVFHPLVRLKAQQSNTLRLDQAPYGVANTASVRVQFKIYDE